MNNRLLAMTSAGMAAALMATAIATAEPADAPPEYEVQSLGVPLSDVLVLGGVVAPAPDGEGDALWGVTGGKPAKLHSVDPLTGEVLTSDSLVEGEGSAYAEGGYGVTAAPNGDVYVGTYYNGRLHRRAAGPDSELEDLGQAIPGETYIYQMEFGDDGKLYGGTFGSGKVFGYDPETDEFRDYGSMIPGQQYVRSLATGEGVVYAGTYDCHVFAIDPETGEKEELPQPAPDCGHVNDMSVIDGLLYARTSDSVINAPVHVYDPAAGEWREGSIPNVAGLDLAPGPDGQIYYMHTDGLTGTLARFDPDTLDTEMLDPEVAGRVVNNRGAGWTELDDPEWPGATLVQMLWRGQIMLYNLETGKWALEQSDVQGEPIGIQTVATGEKDVYLGGYLNGGLGIHDPATGETEFNRFAQIESIHEDGDDVWIGAYPDARKFLFDRTKPWSNSEYSPGPVGSEENPRLLDDGIEEGQVRIAAVTDTGDSVAFGTQPGTSLTGSLVTIDKASNEATYFEGPITDQSNVSLAQHEGVLFGGTSILGAYNQPPPTTDVASVYAFDPDEGELVWSFEARDGMRTIRGVRTTADGDVWVLQNGTITIHDPADGTEKASIQLTGDTSGGNSAGTLSYDETRDVMWAMVQGDKLYRIDVQSGEASLAVEQAISQMAVQPSSGDVYFSSGAEFYSLTSNDGTDPVGPSTWAVASVTIAGRDANAWGTVDGDASVSTEVRLSDGSWATSQTRSTDADGRYVVPLTYGKDSPGTLEWRVRITHADGTVELGDPMRQTRIPRSTVSAAPMTVVGREANAWGTVGGRAAVSTQVRLSDGGWATSQSVTTATDGAYVIPLTYGRNAAGSQDWRIRVEYENGLVEYTEPFTQVRVARPSASSAGTAPVGREASVWGSTGVADAPVWTEVYLGAERGWVRSRQATADASGGYVLPLTYGAGSGGTYRFRVAVQHPGIGTLHSDEFAFVRTLR